MGVSTPQMNLRNSMSDMELGQVLCFQESTMKWSSEEEEHDYVKDG